MKKHTSLIMFFLFFLLELLNPMNSCCMGMETASAATDSSPSKEKIQDQDQDHHHGQRPCHSSNSQAEESKTAFHQTEKKSSPETNSSCEFKICFFCKELPLSSISFFQNLQLFSFYKKRPTLFLSNHYDKLFPNSIFRPPIA